MLMLAAVLLFNNRIAYAYEPEVIDILEDAMLNAQTEADILTDYGLYESDIVENGEGSLMNVIKSRNPIAFACYDSFYICSYRGIKAGGQNLITGVTFSHGAATLTKADFEKRYEEMNKKVLAILDLVDPKWSDFRKILFVHDYLIDNITYESNYTEDNEFTRSCHSAYGALINGRAVCDGYSEAFELIMDQLGIDCMVVSSSAMNHAWNLVKVDGKWYHIDLTHDDPIVNRLGHDLYGTVKHDNFLMSDEYVKNPKNSRSYHPSWETVTPETSTDYDTWPLRDCQTFFIEIDGSLYYADTSADGFLVKEDKTGTKKAINDKKVICLDNVGKYLLYSDEYCKKIYCYNGEEIIEYYSAADNYYIFAFDVKDGAIMIILGKRTGTTYEYETLTKTITEKELAPQQYIFSGNCGDSVKWKLNTKTGLMSITGTGKMADYQYSSRTPWYKYRDMIKKVSVAAGVTRIGTNAFYGCSSLTEVTGCSGVESFGINALRNCVSLSKTAGCAKTTLIEQYAFCGCTKLTTIGSATGAVSIPACTKIGGYAFYECKGIKKLLTSNSINYIGTRAFSNCTSMASVTVGQECNTIASYAFCGNTALVTVNGCAGVTGIGDFAFYGNSKLTSIAGFSKVTNLGKSAFRNCCALVKIGSSADRIYLASVRSVGEYAFSGCKAAKFISLGTGVRTIGQYAFQNTTSLDKLYLRSTAITSIGANALKGFKWNGTIMVPNAKLTAYKTGVLNGKGQGTNVKISGF